MPTYAYACTECQHRFDAQQAFTDAALTECPECTGRLRKLFNAVGIVFKGSGFYRTDSRGKNGSSGTSESDKTSGSSDSGSGSPAKAPAGGDAGSSKGPGKASRSTSGATSTAPSSDATSSAA